MKVIVVEDYKDHLDLLKIKLGRSKKFSRIIACEDYEQAMAAISSPENADTHLVLLDLMLPGGKDGADVIKYIAKHKMKARVIVMSAATEGREGELGRYPFVQIIPKPFSDEHFRYLWAIHE